MMRDIDFSEIDGEFLNFSDILKIHDNVIKNSEVQDDEGFIDETGALFESATASVFAGFGGFEAYPSIESKASGLCFNIIKDHCFRNANKRTGLMVMLSTLEMNGIDLNYDQDKMFDMITKIGSADISFEEFYEYIESCIVSNEMSKSM